MKKNLLFVFLFGILSSPFLSAQNDPVADPNAIIVSGDMRFTVLTPEMIRIEWSDKQQFEDRASFTVINRKLPVPRYTKEEKDGFLYIKTDKLTLQYRIGSFPGTFNPPSSQNLKITFEMDGRTITWYPWKKDPLNLKGTTRTLDGSNGDNKLAEMEDGLLSRAGWYVIDETHPRGDGSISLMFDERESGMDWVSQRKDPDAMDWYFMGYGHNYKKALGDYAKIAGRIPMPPMYAFGYWYSKYERYTSEDFQNLVNEMQANGLPQDVMVIDMDWHHSNPDLDGGIGGWTGWSWNKNLIPDPKGLLDWLDERHLKATLNLHPAYGIADYEDNYDKLYADLESRGMDMTADSIIDKGNRNTIKWNLENEDFYEAFFENILRPHENIGVDFWWLDWQQWLLAPNEDKLSNTFWCNYVFYNDMKLQKKARPIIFHRWGGLGSHRYQIGFSGDSNSNFPTLAFQPYFTATASNVGYGYWSHDIGGHYQADNDNDPERFLRWIQYAVFSPIVRTHSSNNPNVERRMWKYPNFPLMKEAIELRYAMVPYIYTQARIAYDTGISICRPLYYDWPDVNEAYKHGEEYMFGEDILAAPIVTRSDANGNSIKHIWLPEGKWYEVTSGEVLEGGRTHTRTFTQSDIPHYYREGAIIPHFPKVSHLKTRPDTLILRFAPGTQGELNYYEDENDNDNYENGAYTFTRVTQEVTGNEGTYTIYPTEGQFEGMPKERAYEIVLLAVNRPETVTVNGLPYSESDYAEASTWIYNADTRTVRIQIPTTSCSEKTEIVVGFSQTSALPETSEKGNKASLYWSKEERHLQVSFSKTCNEVLLKVFDLTGKTVSSVRHENVQNISFYLPSELPEGVYTLGLTYDGKHETEKIIM